MHTDTTEGLRGAPARRRPFHADSLAGVSFDPHSCTFCTRALDFSKAAVVVGGKGEPIYLPFPEDWRGGLVEMAHPTCFVEAEGLERFLAALARNDERQRP